MLYWRDHNGRDWPVCECLKAWLPAYEAELLRRGLIHTCIDVFQTIGNASASAGTHSKGGCVDLGQRSPAQIWVGRNMGGADWERDADPDDGQPDFRPSHAHISLKGCPHAVQYARDQVDDLEDGFNGLGVLEDHHGAPDDGPRDGVKWPLRTWREGIAWAEQQEAPVAIDLRPWKLTLPTDTDHNGTADEVKQPALATFEKVPWFDRRPDGIAFRANCGGATTSGSKYPRSELREMNGSKPAAWSNSVGKLVLELDMTITHLPTKKPHLVCAQIHDAADDVCMVRLETSMLYVEESLGKGKGSVKHPIAGYRLGERFKLSIVADRSGVRIYYRPVDAPNTVKIHLSRSGSGWYFKCGCYTQSNTSTGDVASAYGEVVLHAARVLHE